MKIDSGLALDDLRTNVLNLRWELRVRIASVGDLKFWTDNADLQEKLHWRLILRTDNAFSTMDNEILRTRVWGANALVFCYVSSSWKMKAIKDDVGRLSTRVNNFRNEDAQGNVKFNVTLENIREIHVQTHSRLCL